MTCTEFRKNLTLAKINCARDLGQLYNLSANISGTNQAIDKRRTALLTTFTSTLTNKNW